MAKLPIKTIDGNTGASNEEEPLFTISRSQFSKFCNYDHAGIREHSTNLQLSAHLFNASQTCD